MRNGDNSGVCNSTNTCHEESALPIVIGMLQLIEMVMLVKYFEVVCAVVQGDLSPHATRLSIVRFKHVICVNLLHAILSMQI